MKPPKQTVRTPILDRYMPLPPGDRWLLKEEVISMLYMSDRTLQRWRSEGIIPYSKIGNKIWYRLSDIIKLLESRMM